MSRKVLDSMLVILSIGLAACGSALPPSSLPAPAMPPATLSAATEMESSLVRTDSQGAVVFAVTPLNLAAPGETLDFDIAMNTHSVAESWDLAAQSTLTTDTGLAVAGLSWPVGTGHHYEGTLKFPVQTSDGQALLKSAKTLTLTIINTDVPQRVFTWLLTK